LRIFIAIALVITLFEFSFFRLDLNIIQKLSRKKLLLSQENIVSFTYQHPHSNNANGSDAVDITKMHFSSHQHRCTKRHTKNKGTRKIDFIDNGGLRVFEWVENGDSFLVDMVEIDA
jgi:hypothetical protein